MTDTHKQIVVLYVFAVNEYTCNFISFNCIECFKSFFM